MECSDDQAIREKQGKVEGHARSQAMLTRCGRRPAPLEVPPAMCSGTSSFRKRTVWGFLHRLRMTKGLLTLKHEG